MRHVTIPPRAAEGDPSWWSPVRGKDSTATALAIARGGAVISSCSLIPDGWSPGPHHLRTGEAPGADCSRGHPGGMIDKIRRRAGFPLAPTMVHPRTEGAKPSGPARSDRAGNARSPVRVAGIARKNHSRRAQMVTLKMTTSRGAGGCGARILDLDRGMAGDSPPLRHPDAPAPPGHGRVGCWHVYQREQGKRSGC